MLITDKEITMAINKSQLAEFLAAYAQTTPRSERRAGLLEYYARCFNMSVAHLRKLARDKGGVKSAYKKRVDSGAPKDTQRAIAAEAVAKRIVAAGGRMPTCVAIDTCQAVGEIPLDLDLPTGYVDLYMRDRNINRNANKGPRETRKIKWEPFADRFHELRSVVFHQP